MAHETPAPTRYVPPTIVTRDRVAGLLKIVKSDPPGVVISDAALKDQVTPVTWAGDSEAGARP